MWESEAGSGDDAASWRGRAVRCGDVALCRGVALRGTWSAVGSASGEAVAAGGFCDDASGDHGGETFVECFGADAAGCAQFGEASRLPGFLQEGGDALIDGSGLAARLVSMIGLHGPQGERVIALDQFERDGGDGRGGAMLDGERDAIVGVAAQIEVGIAPGVEFGRSAQGLTGTDGTGTLPGMVDDGDGDSVTPLQFTQEGEQWGDVAADRGGWPNSDSPISGKPA